MLMLNIGCAQEKKSADSAAVVPTVDCSRTTCANGTPDAPGGSGSDGAGGYYSGATVALTNVQNLSTMFFNAYPNNPTSIQVNIDMNRTLDAVIISYVDGGKVNEAGLGTRFPDDLGRQGTRVNNQYNGWVTEGSSKVYKGFFQDKYGAVVVVIDKVLNIGDGTPATNVGGTIYFQNFGDNPGADSLCQSGERAYTRPNYRPYDTCMNTQLLCWEIQAGPYDCRSFLVGNSVVMNSATNPLGTRGPTRTKSYMKLGDFTGLSRAAANLPSP